MKQYIQPRSEVVSLHLEAPILDLSNPAAHNALPSSDDTANILSTGKGWNSSDWTEGE